MMEEWKDIANWPGYQVSNMGNVRSFWEREYVSMWGAGSKSVIGNTPHLLEQYEDYLMYKKCTLCKDGKKKTWKVHRLVLLSFKGPPPNGKMEVRHLNGNPADNRLENLEWGSRLENEADKKNFKPKRKLTKEEVEQIKQMYLGGSKKTDIAKKFGVTDGAIRGIINGRRHKAK